ncbi:MAG: hypothetical protein AB1817_05930, partial [Chloroflexota bacterium]
MELHLTENRVRTLAGILVIAIVLALAGGASIAFVHPLVPFAAIVGIIAAAIVMSNIDFGLYAVIAVAVLLPFGALPLNLGFNPTFLDLALVAVIAMWFARVTTRQSSGGFVATPLGLPVLAFFVLACFSFIA